jgi:hypothetical protein
MKNLINLTNARPLNRLEQQRVQGGLICAWRWECSTSATFYGSGAACRAACAGGFCTRENPCL